MTIELILGVIGGFLVALFVLLVSAKAKCPVCGGSGHTHWVGVSIIEDCPNCSATGSVSLLNWIIIKLSKKKSSIVR